MEPSYQAILKNLTKANHARDGIAEPTMNALIIVLGVCGALFTLAIVLYCVKRQCNQIKMQADIERDLKSAAKKLDQLEHSQEQESKAVTDLENRLQIEIQKFKNLNSDHSELMKKQAINPKGAMNFHTTPTISSEVKSNNGDIRSRLGETEDNENKLEKQIALLEQSTGYLLKEQADLAQQQQLYQNYHKNNP